MYVDPFYVTASSNHFNQKYPQDYERILKRNYLLNHEGEFESVILGSSRSSFFQEGDFPSDLKIFNFSVSQFLKHEYTPALKWFQETQGNPKTIIVGADFFVTADGLMSSDDLVKYGTRQDVNRHNIYINMNIKNFIYHTFKMLLGGSFNEQYYQSEPFIRKFKSIYPDSDLIEGLETLLMFGYKHYKYKEDTLSTLKNMKSMADQSEFIMYIPVIHMDIFKYIYKNDAFDGYRRFIREIVYVFGYVYDFSGPNSVTTDKQYFFDPSHFNYKISKCIAVKITERQDSSCPSDFGVKVTKENLEAYLDKLEADTAAYLEAEKNQSASAN
ncbi:MAG: hypothetical protein KBF71_08405 [Alphaproteobacteria bacterium]|nr:hypothetical protein [Alphaproteobacteria bacterium]